MTISIIDVALFLTMIVLIAIGAFAGFWFVTLKILDYIDRGRK